MRSRKIIALNIFMILSIFIFSSCSLFEPNENSESNGSHENDFLLEESGNNYIIGQDIIDNQAQYKTQWLSNVKDINSNNRYSGYANIWGSGELAMYFWFDDDGNLWDEMVSYSGDYVLHKLLTDSDNTTENKTTFINGHTAIMFIPSSASYTLSGTLYIVQVTNNQIYRTEDAYGWYGKDNQLTYNNWDGKTIPKSAFDSDNLVSIGKK